MLFYAIANADCFDCFYDFKLDTYGDGLYTENLLPTKKLAETLVEYFKIPDAVIIKVVLNYDDQNTFFEFDNIWG